MIIVNTKRLRELKKENDELKTLLQKFNERQESVYHLDEMLKNMRLEISELQNQKSNCIDSLQTLRETEITAQNEIQKLQKEVEHLRELKTLEKSGVSTITDQLSEPVEFKGNGKGEVTVIGNILPEHDLDIVNAGRKKKELQREIADLENKLKDLYQRIVELSDQEKLILDNIETRSKQLDVIESYRLIDAKAELNAIEKRIDDSRELEKNLKAEFQERLQMLTGQEKNLQEKVILRIRELEELEEKITSRSYDSRKVSEGKIITLIAEEQKLIDSIEQKRRKIEELNMTVSSLEEEMKQMTGTVKSAKGETPEDSTLEDTRVSVEKLQEEAGRLKDTINQLKMTEELKRELISKLKDELSAKELAFAALENDFAAKSDQLKEVSIKNRELAEEIEFQNKKLTGLTSSLHAKSLQLNEYDEQIKFLEDRIKNLNNEITERELMKTESENKILEEKQIVKKLEDRQKSLKADISSLEARQKEILESNKVFEARFAQLFDQYSTNMNEMNRKKNLLVHMLQKKETEIKEQDDMILEKLSMLDETEKVLQIRQKEVDAFDELLKTINDQKELIKDDLNNLDQKAAEKRIQNRGLRTESEILQRNITEFEKSLKEILNGADNRLKNSIEKKGKLDSEIREYEIRLKELNANIKDSMNELVDLRSAIGNIKIEHEEHRLEINKLVSLRNKLQSEISKSRVIVDKYRMIKERIRREQETIKKRREERLKAEINTGLPHQDQSKGVDLTKMFRL